MAQLYLRGEYASVTRPARELKGFYSNAGKFSVEPGEFLVFVGGDSNATLSSKFEVE